MTRRVVVEADGGSRGNPGPAGYGAVVRDADTGEVLREVAAGIGTASNNVAEYRGLIAGLQATLDLSADDVEVRMDSKLVVEQMSGRWKVKHPAMQELAREAAGLVRRLPSVRFVHVRREFNSHADRLANEAMDAAAAGGVWKPVSGATPGEPVRPPALYGWNRPTGPRTTGFLLRHGETALSVERRFSGHGDTALSDRGERQAKAAAVRLTDAGIVRIVASPLRRTRQTAEAVAATLRLPVDVNDGLAECDFGAWEGLTFAEVKQRWPDELSAWLSDPNVAPPDGESLRTTARRVLAARDRIVADCPDVTVLVVTHVTPIKVLVRDALHAPDDAVHRMYLDVASLSIVDWTRDGGVVRTFNESGYLGEAATPSSVG